MDTLLLDAMATPVEIVREMKFATAHQLPYQGYPGEAGTGKCTRLHGHTYVLQLGVRGPVRAVDENDPESGMVVDFERVKAMLKDIHDNDMDHHYANDTLDGVPTAERMLLRIALRLKEKFEDSLPDGVYISFLRLYEEWVPPASYAEVRFKGRGWRVAEY